MSTNESPKINTEEFQNPPFLFEQYFQGRTIVTGIFEERFRKNQKQFSAVIVGTGNSNSFELDETIQIEGSKPEKRVWKIKKLNSNEYEAKATGIVGIAKGISTSNSIRWSYDMLLPFKNRHFRTNFDDRMFLQPSGILLNVVTIRKFSFVVATLTLVYTKTAEEVNVVSTN